jgi:excisionase family DNA binding protein
MENSELLTTKDAAKYLGVKVYWLQTHWKSERIPAIRLSSRGRLFFRKRSLDTWLTSREVEGGNFEYPLKSRSRSKLNRVQLV